MADHHRMREPALTERITCVLPERRQDLAAFAEACFRFSPRIAVSHEAVFIEVGASRALFSEAGVEGGLSPANASIEARLKVLAGRLLSSPVRVATAGSAAAALAAARYPRYARTRNLEDLPIEALLDFASPFAWDEDVSKAVARVACLMGSLGVQGVAEFARIPPAGLASRFGKEAVNLSAKVRGELVSPWPGFHPLPRIVERDEVRDPEAHGLCMDLEGCVFVLRGLVDRAMARLRGRGERASVLRIQFGPGTLRHWRVELPLPQGSTAGLLPILRERLAFDLGREPLRQPVESVELEILESTPGAGTQKDFFSRKEEEQEAWDGLVARLAEKLGKDRVFVAFPRERYLPERAYLRRLVPVASLLREASREPVVGGVRAVPGRHAEVVEWPDRPARVLRKPEPLRRDGRVLQALDGRRWKAVSWEGPERLSGEWWRDPAFEGFNRDYYRVVTESGEQLWVFLNNKAKTPAFYLHGYFD